LRFLRNKIDEAATVAWVDGKEGDVLINNGVRERVRKGLGLMIKYLIK
jgi:hypothetical protein